jgi:NAD(P)-dependent dehydrogenase (short-subunit alcohol dehydrogenase family)
VTARTRHPGLTHTGRVALVTGGGSGIGLETALTLADLGADVAILDWTPGAAKAAAAEVEKIGRKALAFEGDTGDEKTVVDAFEATREILGPVDVAVACAGVLGDGGPVFTTSVEDFERVMGINVRGSFLVTREAAKQMRPRKSGAIVLLSSLDGLQAEHGMFSYCTSKGALLNLARAAALDLARDRITVNCVCPSVTVTPLLEGRLATLPNGDEVLRSYAERHPLGRVLSPRDIATAIAFLTSPIASGITGAAIPVDAGIGATWDNYRDPPWAQPPMAQSPRSLGNTRQDSEVDP